MASQESTLVVFEIKEGVNPSEALKQLEEGFSILDCGIACHLAAYRALRDVITPEKFDHLCAHDSPFRLRLSYNDPKSPIEQLFKHVNIDSEDDIQEGDIVHFSNIQEYVAKHPVGTSRGFNLLCSDQASKKYIGLGTSPGGLQSRGVEELFWTEHNDTPVDEEIIPQTLWSQLYSKYLLGHEESSRKFVASLKDKTITWESFHETPARLASKGSLMQGKLCLDVIRPNIQRIEELAQTPKEQIREVFARYVTK